MPGLPFNGVDVLENCCSELNSYFLLKILIDDEIDLDEKLLQKMLISITEQELIDFAASYKWNGLIFPAAKPDEVSFLGDVLSFTNKFNVTSIDVSRIANHIYDSLPHFTVHHIKLWLWAYVDDSRFDYVLFRDKFKELTPYEQKEFRRRGDYLIKCEIEEWEALEVVPCTNIVFDKGAVKVYEAFIENIFFKEGCVQLRLENGEYTKPFCVAMASSGFNRISKSSPYNKLPFEIMVKGKQIIEVKGLESLFSKIHTGEIFDTLSPSEPASPDSPANRNKAYVEDWKLRKKIIDYLNEQQYNDAPKLVNEPKSRYRRLDASAPIDFFEKTLLFSIKTADGYGIVWENIDLTNDRATFVFKTSESTHEMQLQKVADSIVSFGRFRSTLSADSNTDVALQIFRNNLGYVSKIYKKRGSNQSFSNWQEKLEKALSLPIPPLPTAEELKSLEVWLHEGSRSGQKGGTVRRISEDSITTTDDLQESETDMNFPQGPMLTLDLKKSILSELRDINRILKNS